VVIVFIPMSRHTRRTKPVTVTSVRQAAAVCDVTPPVVRRWLSLGLISGPPWTIQQLQQIRERPILRAADVALRCPTAP
jgi:hypothetical protein